MVDNPSWLYTDYEKERFVAESAQSSIRSHFARDRARVLHSSGFRRLAAKTQVLSPAQDGYEHNVARTRLTHSLEVAQVGRELATHLGIDPDVVDTACLTHDIGHPPFGHNGEKALNSWAKNIGGFEANAQTFRLLTRLEPKMVDHLGHPVGLNLTRASLQATSKYPWTSKHAKPSDEEGVYKYGIYEDDIVLFEWMQQKHSTMKPCLEASVMDLADDIAYSVHDFEDAIVENYLDVQRFNNAAHREQILNSAYAWSGQAFSATDFETAFGRLLDEKFLILSWDGSYRAQAHLKNVTSSLIGRFVYAAIQETKHVLRVQSVHRSEMSVVVAPQILCEIAVLKGIVAASIMKRDSRKPYYEQQRNMLHNIANFFWQTGSKHMERIYQDRWEEAESEDRKQRIVVDQVAGLTDQAAIAWDLRIQKLFSSDTAKDSHDLIS